MNTCRLPSGKSRRRRGSTLVEFALVVPFLLALMIGIVEFAILSRNQLMISNAVREGARSASLGRNVNTVKTRIKNGTTMLALTDAQIALDYSTNDGASYGTPVSDSGTVNNAPAGSLVRATVAYPHRPLTGFFPYLKNRTIRVSVSMRRETS